MKNFKARLSRGCAALATLFLTVSCGGGGSTSPPTATTVAISVLAVGK